MCFEGVWVQSTRVMRAVLPSCLGRSESSSFVVLLEIGVVRSFDALIRI
jgi:hypothetical protein